MHVRSRTRCPATPLLAAVLVALLLNGTRAAGYGTGTDAAPATEKIRTAAESGDPVSQRLLAIAYAEGKGVVRNPAECLRWATLAANQGDTVAQCLMGAAHEQGFGVARNQQEAFRWYTMAAEAGDAHAQGSLGRRFLLGKGVTKDYGRARLWLMRGALQGDAAAQMWLAYAYGAGLGVPRNTKIAYAWACLGGAAYDNDLSRRFIADLEARLPPQDRSDAQQLAAEFVARPERRAGAEDLPEPAIDHQQRSTGSGFFITTNGYFVTNLHVVEDAHSIRIKTSTGVYDATLVSGDPGNDIAILKVDGIFPALHVRGSRGLRMADRVATVGYPTPDVQGMAAKYCSGEVAAVSGLNDDARLIQITVPIQPGNSGGPLVDMSGNVVGVIVAQWDKAHAIVEKGFIPENVNYAIKGTILLGIIEAIPAVAERLSPDPSPSAVSSADVAARVELATGMVMVSR